MVLVNPCNQTHYLTPKSKYNIFWTKVPANPKFKTNVNALQSCVKDFHKNFNFNSKKTIIIKKGGDPVMTFMSKS